MKTSQHLTNMMKDLLAQLEEKMGLMPQNCFFNEAVGYDELMDFLDPMPFLFPLSHMTFLLNYNGGFICREEINTMSFDTLAWNSNRFLSIHEIETTYNRICHKFSKKGPLFVPFMQVENCEYLAFTYPYEEYESPVYDIWHEVYPNEWLHQEVYSGFEALLKDYIANNGTIVTVG